MADGDVYAPGASDIDITQIMKNFGYTPTQAEAQSLAGSFNSANNAASKAQGLTAVSMYVNQKLAEQEREKNDPLAALQQKMQDSADQMKSQVKGLYTQLQDTLGSAPELFGNMTPDQISTYLAPLQTAFKSQMDLVQGTIASRGLTGSSTENNALAQTGEQFKENVLSTGLSVGQSSQQAKATAIQNQINALLGLTGTEENIAGSSAGQRSSQNLGQSNLISSLPFFLQQASNEQALIDKQLNSGGGFMNTFHQVTSGINEGMNAFESLAGIPAQFKTAPNAGTPYASASGPNLPGSNPYTSAGQTLMPGGSSSPLSLNSIPEQPALFAAG